MQQVLPLATAHKSQRPGSLECAYCTSGTRGDVAHPLLQVRKPPALFEADSPRLSDTRGVQFIATWYWIGCLDVHLASRCTAGATSLQRRSLSRRKLILNDLPLPGLRSSAPHLPHTQLTSHPQGSQREHNCLHVAALRRSGRRGRVRSRAGHLAPTSLGRYPPQVRVHLELGVKDTVPKLCGRCCSVVCSPRSYCGMSAAPVTHVQGYRCSLNRECD